MSRKQVQDAIRRRTSLRDADIRGLDLSGLRGIWEVQSELRQWTALLRSVPKCWAIAQPLLCSVLMPECAAKGAERTVEMVSHNLCRVAQGPCRVVAELGGWPEYLKCNNTRVFNKECRYRDGVVHYNTSSAVCPQHLVLTEKSSAHFKDFEGCGLSCKSPMFSEEDYGSVSSLLGWSCFLCFVVLVLTLVTSGMAGWREVNKFPIHRDEGALVQFGDTVLSVGGADEDNDALDLIFQYDVENDEWFLRQEEAERDEDDVKAHYFPEAAGLCNPPLAVDYSG